MHGVVPRYLKLIFSNFWLFMLISALMLFVLMIVILLNGMYNQSADFHSICGCPVHESVGEALKFTIAASHKIGVVGKL